MKNKIPNIVLAGMLTVILLMTLGMLTSIKGQQAAIIEISEDKIIVAVQYAPTVKEYKKAVKLVVSKGIISRKISEISIVRNTYKVVPTLDGKITYNLYVNGAYEWSSTKIADIRKKIVELDLFYHENM